MNTTNNNLILINDENIKQAISNMYLDFYTALKSDRTLEEVEDIKNLLNALRKVKNNNQLNIYSAALIKSYVSKQLERPKEYYSHKVLLLAKPQSYESIIKNSDDVYEEWKSINDFIDSHFNIVVF